MSLHRGKRITDNKWVWGYPVIMSGDCCDVLCLCSGSLTANDYGEILGDYDEIFPETLGRTSELYDLNGEEIFEHDILKFEDEHGVWIASVIFERGLFGLDVYHPKQIENPKNWNFKHDVVKSRGWGAEWGYEAFGTWFTYKKPLAQKTIISARNNEEKALYENLNKKYGVEKYYVQATKVGNIHDNPELLK